MRRIAISTVLGLVAIAGCTVNFDEYRVGAGDASVAGAGGGSAAAGGMAAAGGIGGSAGGGGVAATGGGAGSGGMAAAGGVAGTDGGADSGGAAGIGGSAGADAGDADAGCAPGSKLCGGSCVSVDDPSFGCDALLCAPCALDNATAECVAGACSVQSCNPGFGNCDGDPNNGCEVSTQSSTAHCGSCGNECVLPNAVPACQGGQCLVSSCEPDFDDCNAVDSDGCEASLLTDADHCGDCITVCQPVGSSSCNAGNCALDPCASGLGECDGDTTVLCETDLNTSVDHCGACDAACQLANATPRCLAGQCEVLSCDANFDDCDTNPANGCEVDLRVNASHCGDCTTACTNANGTTTCSAGVCDPSCASGFGDCNSDPNDGCETDLGTTASSCGDCGIVCDSTNGTAVCSDGNCDITCDAGWKDCDGDPSNGCEAYINSDVDNCGDCGRACSTANVLTLACSSGVCTSACQLGSDNCSQPTAPSTDDGCETDTTQDNLNCGGCSNSCQAQSNGGLICGDQLPGLCGCGGSNQACRNGNSTGVCDTSTDRCRCGTTLCAYGESCFRSGAVDSCSCNGASACSAGEVCCDTPAGCFDLRTDSNNCGGCGRTCPRGFACQNAGCVCTSSAQCDAGGGGSCNVAEGFCVCDGKDCKFGERCQADGQCG